MAETNEKKEKDWRLKEIDGLKKLINGWRWFFLFLFWTDLGFIAFNIAINQQLFVSRSTLVWILVIALLGWYTTHCLKFVKAWERGVVFRWGKMLPKKPKESDERRGLKRFFRNILNRVIKFENPQEPGPVWIFYLLGEKMVFVQMWARTEDIKPQKVITQDLIEATVDILFFWRVTDPCDFATKAEDPILMAAEIVWATLRSEVGSKDFKEVYAKQEEISNKLIEVLKKEGYIEAGTDKGWGLEILTVKVQNVIPPPGYSEAMLNLAVSVQNAEAVRKTAAGKRDAEIMEANAVKYRKVAEAKGNAAQTRLQVEAFGPEGAKILAATMIAGMVQKGDKLIIDPTVAGIPAITSFINETLNLLKKQSIGGQGSESGKT